MALLSSPGNYLFFSTELLPELHVSPLSLVPTAAQRRQQAACLHSSLFSEQFSAVPSNPSLVGVEVTLSPASQPLHRHDCKLQRHGAGAAGFTWAWGGLLGRVRRPPPTSQVCMDTAHGKPKPGSMIDTLASPLCLPAVVLADSCSAHQGDSPLRTDMLELSFHLDTHYSSGRDPVP